MGRARKAVEVAVVGGPVVFFAQAEDGPEPGGPARGVLEVRGQVEQPDLVGLTVTVHCGARKRRAAGLLDHAVVERHPHQGVFAVQIDVVIA